jgi:hypothetical protein
MYGFEIEVFDHLDANCRMRMSLILARLSNNGICGSNSTGIS